MAKVKSRRKKNAHLAPWSRLSEPTGFRAGNAPFITGTIVSVTATLRPNDLLFWLTKGCIFQRTRDRAPDTSSESALTGRPGALAMRFSERKKFQAHTGRFWRSHIFIVEACATTVRYAAPRVQGFAKCKSE